MKSLPAETEIIVPWDSMTLKEKRAALARVNRIRRTQGKEAARRAWLASGMLMTDDMVDMVAKKI